MLPLVNELCGELGSSKLSTAAGSERPRWQCGSCAREAPLLPLSHLLRLRAARHAQEEAQALHVQPRPRALQRAACKAADSHALPFGHPATVIVMHRFPAWMPSLFRVSDLLVRISEAGERP